MFTLEMKSHICSDSDSEGNFLKINIFLYFYRYNMKFDNFSKNIQYADLGTATLRSQAIVE